MKNMCYLAFIVLLSCDQQKTDESGAIDSVGQDTLITRVSESLPDTIPAKTEPEFVFTTIAVEDNILLAGVASYPFSKELEVIKEMLDSLGVPAEFAGGEYGGLSYDSAEITCNRSYGESICEADVRSKLIPLSNGMKIGISLDEFLTLTGINKTSNDQHVRYEYTYGANEHAYTIQFDFVNKKLIRFHYLKDPCVIYD